MRFLFVHDDAQFGASVAHDSQDNPKRRLVLVDNQGVVHAATVILNAAHILHKMVYLVRKANSENLVRL